MEEDYQPTQCDCGSKDYKDVCTERIDWMEVERDRICNKCNTLMGCWAYGYWQPK
jgi:hypothetical protein